VLRGLRATDLAAVMPERLARMLAAPGMGFALRALPFEATAFEWSLYWHRRREGSAEHAWLRGLLSGAVQGAGRVAIAVDRQGLPDRQGRRVRRSRHA
jgi:DNA-binding transcriptional LysR family regulator